jgi:hypothetical protein
MRTKAEVLGELRKMLGDVFAAKAAGQTNAKLARAHGYVDGYMRALLDTDAVTKVELLELVSGEREKASGPALRALANADDSSSSVRAA